MLINFYKDKEYVTTIDFDKFIRIEVLDGEEYYKSENGRIDFIAPDDTYFFARKTNSVKNSKSLAEEISIYAALGEKLICVNISDEYELGYKIIPLSDFSFAEDRE